MRFRNLLADWRHMRRLSLEAAAAEIGISSTVLSRIERGENVQGESVVKLITWALGEEPQPAPAQLLLEGPLS